MEFVRPLPDTTESQLEPIPTWESRIVIPVTENVLGGISVGAAWMGVTIALQFWNIQFDLYNAGIFAALAGGAWAAFWNIVRFSGDEIGIVTGAYQMGRADEHALLMPRIAALELELRASYDAQSAAEANGNVVSAIRDRQTMMVQTRKDAAKLIEVAFANDSTSRAAMKGRGMGQRDWERAVRLLMASGAMNGDGIIVATNPSQALHAIDEQLSSDSQQSSNFAMKWQ